MEFGFFPTEGGPTFSGVVEEVQTAERVGFDACWLTEHHQSTDNYWPGPLQRLSAIAMVTDDLQLVTAVVVLPLHNAVEIAERAAMLDQLSKGRLILGCGVGYVREEFEGYGIPRSERGRRFEEGMRLLRTYLGADGPVSFDGDFWSLDGWEPVPHSYQEPRPPLWVGGYSEAALQRSITVGDAWLPGAPASLDDLVERQTTLEAKAAETDRTLSSMPRPLMREVIIAESPDKAQRIAKEHLHRTYTDEYGSTDWSHPLIEPEVAASFDRVAENRFLVGTPDQVIEQLRVFRDRFGVTHLGCRFHHPGMDHETVLEQLLLFGEEVIPVFD